MMGKVRNQKWICLFLAIAVMISGICLEKIPTDSYFSYSQNSTLTKADKVLRDVSVCRMETLSQREVLSSFRTAKREIRRNQIRTGLQAGISTSYAQFLLKNFQLNHLAEVDRTNGEGSCSVAILSYIHKQDGEKA